MGALRIEKPLLLMSLPVTVKSPTTSTSVLLNVIAVAAVLDLILLPSTCKLPVASNNALLTCVLPAPLDPKLTSVVAALPTLTTVALVLNKLPILLVVVISPPPVNPLPAEILTVL